MEITSSYVYIPVRDIVMSADWYAENLGFKSFKRDPIFIEMRTASGIRIILISTERGINSHMRFQNGPQEAYGFTVNDVEGVYQELKDNGIVVDKISNYAGMSFGFHDPDGNIIELWGGYPEK